MPGRPILSDFRVHLPAHRGSHTDVVNWLAAAHARAEQTRNAHEPDFDPGAFRRQMERHLRRFAPSPETVGHRYSDIGEFLDEDFAGKELFPLDRKPEGVSTAARMDAFAAFAERAVRALYAGEEAPPGEIVHVTCTGYAAPSAPQVLIEERGWQSRTRVTHAYHMGCYAALPAVRIAAGYRASGASGNSGNRCDIVHTEVCSLHLNPARHEPEQLVVQSLFADGFIRYSLGDSAEGGGLEVLGFAERIVPGSLVDIQWAPGDFGMRMTLSRDVPDKVGPELDSFTDALAASSGLSRAELERAVWAVHPGGPRIVDKVQEWMKLEAGQLRASREILFERGNMSSATLPHIWDRIVRDPSVTVGTPVVSLAFGPGLTIYGAVMRKV
ncbi:MAG TPA: 3-oxoacyl-[acyl-carrier-protein] synthase III C-terminal domain-containing protein [Fibrobacteria bacterium]|nr:3-oxoacyl-[acyl-carrier-protein] synthase III C-terminal domain-containing protein [Fibrobacteria bacterium]